MTPTLKTPVSKLYGIGPSYVSKLKKLGIETAKDLIFHFPHRYEDFSNIKKISDLKAGEKATIIGKILAINSIRTPRKRMFLTEAVIQDKTGAIRAIWFNQPFLSRTLKRSMPMSLSGKIGSDSDSLFLSNPVYEIVLDRNAKSGAPTNRVPTNYIPASATTTHTGRLVPIYPETQGLSSRWLRYYIKSLMYLIDKMDDFLPAETRRNACLTNLQTALKQIHFPGSEKKAKQAKYRLAFDELFLLQFKANQEKQKWNQQKAPKIAFNQKLIKSFVKSLPFKLTNAQRKAVWQIFKDLEKTKPMNRLLEGDVGSGKTVVAAMAALSAVKKETHYNASPLNNASLQIAFMTPTEILAQQHFKTFCELLGNFDINIGLLTGSCFCKYQKEQNKILFGQKSKISEPNDKCQINTKIQMTNIKKKKINFIKNIQQGKIDILIGTHALIQEKIKFKNLGLVIVDEQHRFGVKQRARLKRKITGQLPHETPEIVPHLLTMTATPIPRTLALTIYGDLDISVLDEMPKGRQKIITHIVAPANRRQAYEFIKGQIQSGRQAFVICPLIEESESIMLSETKAVKIEYEKLNKNIFPNFKIGILHGKLKVKEKQQVMQKFKNKKLDILVATSVIEVGIDVQNATVIMIESSERFGLAQLHQFRGRVGRGKYQSYCFLFTDSGARNTSARLRALIKCENGFELAEKDLKIRGPGEFFGIRQSGLPDLCMASLTNLPLIQKTKKAVKMLLKKDPTLKKYPLLREKLKEFKQEVHFE